MFKSTFSILRAAVLAGLMTATVAAPSLADTATTVMQALKENDQFTTLKKLVEAVGLTEALEAEGPMTVFAPTDKAFESLPGGVLEEWMDPENRDLVIHILSFHVAPTKVTGASDVKFESYETLSGEFVDVERGDDFWVHNARVLKADIEAENGVVHALDRIMLPRNTTF